MFECSFRPLASDTGDRGNRSSRPDIKSRASCTASYVRPQKRQNHSALTMGVVVRMTQKKYWGNGDVHGDVHCLGFPRETKKVFRDDQMKELISPSQFYSCVKNVSWTFDPQAPVIHRLAAGYFRVSFCRRRRNDINHERRRFRFGHERRRRRLGRWFRTLI